MLKFQPCFLALVSAQYFINQIIRLILKVLKGKK